MMPFLLLYFTCFLSQSFLTFFFQLCRLTSLNTVLLLALPLFPVSSILQISILMFAILRLHFIVTLVSFPFYHLHILFPYMLYALLSLFCRLLSLFFLLSIAFLFFLLCFVHNVHFFLRLFFSFSLLSSAISLFHLIDSLPSLIYYCLF